MIATLYGGYLRLAHLGVLPLWCDEAIFATRIYDGTVFQEFLPMVVSHILGVGSEFTARLPFAIAGILTIPAVYWSKPSKWGAYASVIVAVCPLFVFYSRMCRPYAMAALFIVIAWRCRWWYWAVLLTTPIALAGIDITKMRRDWLMYAGLGVCAVTILLVRPDLGRKDFFTLDMFLGNPRLWYVPLIALLMYVVHYAGPALDRRSWVYGLLFQGICFLTAFPMSAEAKQIKDFGVGPPLKTWYSHVIYYNNWRGKPEVDLATNFIEITRYYTGHGAVLLRPAYAAQIDSVLLTKDTVRVGVDSYALHMSKWFFPQAFVEQNAAYLFNGGVMVLELSRPGNGLEEWRIISPDFRSSRAR
ncbi:MAG: hypothetical protein IPI01_00240 [Ignavibacteriae bacterium]|nr:hypothetical protein [Ignavibacteriota bacterium]